MKIKKKVGRPLADPVLKKFPFSTKLPCWLLEWMRDTGRTHSIPVLIEHAMKTTYRIGPAEEVPK